MSIVTYMEKKCKHFEKIFLIYSQKNFYFILTLYFFNCKIYSNKRTKVLGGLIFMILNFKQIFIQKSYFSINLLGKNFKLNINYSKVNDAEVNKLENEINITLPMQYKNSDNMNIINLCIQKLYSEVAILELEYVMEFARHIFGFAPEDFKIKRLANDYYKYASKTLTINPDIVQFSKEIIFTTIIKAFCRIKYRYGSKNYLDSLEFGLNEYKKYKNKKSNKELWAKIS